MYGAGCPLAQIQAYLEGSYDLPSATLQVIEDQAITTSTSTTAIRMALELTTGNPTSSSLIIFDPQDAPLAEATGTVHAQSPGEFAAEFFSKIASSLFADVPSVLIELLIEFQLIFGPAPLLAFLVATMPNVRVCG